MIVTVFVPVEAVPGNVVTVGLEVRLLPLSLLLGKEINPADGLGGLGGSRDPELRACLRGLGSGVWSPM